MHKCHFSFSYNSFLFDCYSYVSALDFYVIQNNVLFLDINIAEMLFLSELHNTIWKLQFWALGNKNTHTQCQNVFERRAFSI